ncbi:uncharacterized protein LOC115891090 [Sitophilus oryzae]|uniref:Uncharacterized protein LOC115891090 n=1 Tax=Sitophilus oryzae TaxID=7048 RepID=A0A6J2YWX1_SITOR|nr:uncharacterized protein LOC115891090 [Sitophilus oryzae]
MWLDTKLNFADHINKTITKAEKTVTALALVMPNVGGARASKRRVLASVVHSQLLYAAPVWHKVTNGRNLMQRLRRIQRIMSIRVCSTYKTVSGDAIGVIAEIAPIDLLIQERYDRYHGMDKKSGKDKTSQTVAREME